MLRKSAVALIALLLFYSNSFTQIIRLNLSKTSFELGDSTEITWHAEKAKYVMLKEFYKNKEISSRRLPTQGKLWLKPKKEHIYRFYAYKNKRKFIYKPLHFNIYQAKIPYFKADNYYVNFGDSVTISWQTYKAQRVRLKNLDIDLPPKGSLKIPMRFGDSTEVPLTLQAFGKFTTAQKTILIHVKRRKTLTAITKVFKDFGRPAIYWYLDGARSVKIDGQTFPNYGVYLGNFRQKTVMLKYFSHTDTSTITVEQVDYDTIVDKSVYYQLKLMNQKRIKRGFKPLTIDPTLEKIAYLYLLNSDFFSSLRFQVNARDIITLLYPTDKTGRFVNYFTKLKISWDELNIYEDTLLLLSPLYTRVGIAKVGKFVTVFLSSEPKISGYKSKIIRNGKPHRHPQLYRALLVFGGDIPKKDVRELYHLAKQLYSYGLVVDTLFFSYKSEDFYNLSRGANIFIYRGHGGDVGQWTGIYKDLNIMLYLNVPASDRAIVYRTDFVNRVKLADNAMVLLLHACYSAGSSADDLEEGITLEEAVRRVSDYAKLMAQKNVSLYLANGFFYSDDFINELFGGENLLKAFKDIGDIFAPTQYHQTFKFNSKYKLIITGGMGQYGLAMLYKKNFKITNILKP